jgi:hypothetical protein
MRYLGARSQGIFDAVPGAICCDVIISEIDHYRD